MEITRADIDRVSQIMGKDFSDAERTDVLQCMDCCDVNACPGSGKTTTMVAKLLILSEKLAGTMTGICALSHTNAAKDEIEKSLAPHSVTLMRYPHFVGTIQVFTDLFLAIPAYIEEFGHRPVAIDDDLYENVARKAYLRLSYTARSCLEKQKNPTGIDFFSGTSYSFTGCNLIYFDSSVEKAFPAGKDRPTYIDTLKVKSSLTKMGYLTYHDAFAYANRYLQKYPGLARIISQRFSYVFIDEMQDTDCYQIELLETIFRGRSIIQRFGDPNQTIYGQRSQGGESIWRPEENHSIRTSRRLSSSISRISQGICSRPHEIRGNSQIPDYPHSIILFDQSRRQDVIPRFGQIIEALPMRGGIFKALGAIGRPNQNPDHLSITSYWPSFQRRLQQNTVNNPFWGFVHQAQSSINITKNYSGAYQLFIRAYTELLRIQQVRTRDGHSYNSGQLLKSIRESGIVNFNLFKEIILTNCERLMAVGDLDIDNTLAQTRLVFSFLSLQLEDHAEGIIRNRNGQNLPAQSSMIGDPNIYTYSPGISIEVNTIHSVKGQTHQATLVLETFYHQNDLSKIQPYLVGNNISNPGVYILNRFLPLTYVACTRPSHLLCLAIQRDHVDDNQIGLLGGFGWRIIDLN